MTPIPNSSSYITPLQRVSCLSALCPLNNLKAGQRFSADERRQDRAVWGQSGPAGARDRVEDRVRDEEGHRECVLVAASLDTQLPQHQAALVCLWPLLHLLSCSLSFLCPLLRAWPSSGLSPAFCPLPSWRVKSMTSHPGLWLQSHLHAHNPCSCVPCSDLSPELQATHSAAPSCLSTDTSNSTCPIFLPTPYSPISRGSLFQSTATPSPPLPKQGS